MPAREESGSKVPRYVVTEPGTSGTRYPRNKETGTSGARYLGTKSQWCSVPKGMCRESAFDSYFSFL